MAHSVVVPSHASERLLMMVRWIVLGPCAAVATFVAFAAVRLLNDLSTNPEFSGSFFDRVGVEAMASAAAGGALVATAVFVAPSSKRATACVAAGAGLVIAGVLLSSALPARNWWAMWEIGWFVVAVIVTGLEEVRKQSPQVPLIAFGRTIDAFAQSDDVAMTPMTTER